MSALRPHSSAGGLAILRRRERDQRCGEGKKLVRAMRRPRLNAVDDVAPLVEPPICRLQPWRRASST